MGSIAVLKYRGTFLVPVPSVLLCWAWYGMEWKMEWNGTEISVWIMEDARMEWNERFQEWNGRQSSILPYQFHTRFRALYLQKNTY